MKSPRTKRTVSIAPTHPLIPSLAREGKPSEARKGELGAGLKFVLISPFSSESGSAIRFWHIAKHLSLLGHKVVYCERRRPNGPAPKSPNFRYFSSSTLPGLVLDIVYSFFFNSLVVLRNLDADIFYALKPAPNNCLPILAMKFLGKRIILDIDDLDYGYFQEGSLKYRLSKMWFEILPRYFELVTCHTRKLEEYIVKTLKIPDAKIYYLAQGVSDEFLNLDLDGKTPRKPGSIIYVATLGITSDFEDLIPIFVDLKKAHPDFTLTVVGDGVRRSYFEKTTTDAGLAQNVQFVGRVRHDELPALMLKHQIGINYMRPSFTNDCRAILKIREYLACGLSVVCNDVGDAREFGILVKIAMSLEELTTLLIEVLGDFSPLAGSRRSEALAKYQWRGITEAFMTRIESKCA